MKKLNRILTLCLVLFILALPVVLVGCTSREDYSYIDVQIENPGAGKIYGAGNYRDGDSVTIAAIANDGYVFEKWNDNNFEPARTITVNGSETYIASFVRADGSGAGSISNKKYVVDKVEVFAEKVGNLTAKSVYFQGLDISCSTSNAFVSKTEFPWKSMESGYKMIETQSNGTSVLATESYPIILGSNNHSENTFSYGQSVQLKFILDYTCSSVYYDDNYKVHYNSKFDGNSSSHTLVNKSATHTFVVGQGMQSKVLLADESAHGYKIYSKISFAAI